MELVLDRVTKRYQNKIAVDRISLRMKPEVAITGFPACKSVWHVFYRFSNFAGNLWSAWYRTCFLGKSHL